MVETAVLNPEMPRPVIDRNFVNVKHKPLSLALGDFLGIYDGAYNHVRFGGPETVKELMEQINEERSIEIQSMEP